MKLNEGHITLTDAWRPIFHYILDIEIPPMPVKNRTTMIVPVISTKHITQNDRDVVPVLNDLAFTRDDQGSHIISINKENAEEFKALSEAFREIIACFQEHNVRYLCLDPEGHVIEGLPTFD